MLRRTLLKLAALSGLSAALPRPARASSPGADTVDVEHGVHGWWHQYVHFKDLLRRADLHHRLNERDPKGTYRWAGGEMNASG